MDTDKMLRSYGLGNRPNFGQIAKHASKLEGYALQEYIKHLLSEKPDRIGMRDTKLPYAMFPALGLPLDSGGLDQMNIAMRLPVAVEGAVMPDMHQGYSLPIGGVVRLDHAISPAFVGADISCSMKLTILNGLTENDLTYKPVREEVARLLSMSTSFGLGSQNTGKGKWADHKVMHDSRWDAYKPLKALRALAKEQLGSSGSSNHFADIVVGQVINDGISELKKGSTFVALMTHSGSRGTGKKLFDYYTNIAEAQTAEHFSVAKGYGWLDLDSRDGTEYLDVMNLMHGYALANHEIIHQRFIENTKLKEVRTFSNSHNLAWVQEDGTVIHRKGATPAGKGQVGIIPGSSGTMSYLCVGKGNPASLESSSHGAGRPYSRSKAKELYNAQTFLNYMDHNDITYQGVSPDETYAAYKSIDAVMAGQADLVTPVAELRPRVVVMGGNVKSDDGD